MEKNVFEIHIYYEWTYQIRVGSLMNPPSALLYLLKQVYFQFHQNDRGQLWSVCVVSVVKS